MYTPVQGSSSSTTPPSVLDQERLSGVGETPGLSQDDDNDFKSFQEEWINKPLQAKLEFMWIHECGLSWVSIATIILIFSGGIMASLLTDQKTWVIMLMALVNCAVTVGPGFVKGWFQAPKLMKEHYVRRQNADQLKNYSSTMEQIRKQLTMQEERDRLSIRRFQESSKHDFEKFKQTCMSQIETFSTGVPDSKSDVPVEKGVQVGFPTTTSSILSVTDNYENLVRSICIAYEEQDPITKTLLPTLHENLEQRIKERKAIPMLNNEEDQDVCATEPMTKIVIESAPR